PPGFGDLEQDLLVKHRRAPQQGPGHQELILTGELSDHHARRIGKLRQPFGELDPRDQFGLWHEVDQDLIEQVDLPRPPGCGVLKEQLGNAARGLSPSFWIPARDDVIESGDLRRGNCHRTRLEPTRSTRLNTRSRAGPLARSQGTRRLAIYGGLVKEGLGLKFVLPSKLPALPPSPKRAISAAT